MKKLGNMKAKKTIKGASRQAVKRIPKKTVDKQLPDTLNLNPAASSRPVHLTVNGRQHRLEVGRDFPVTMTLATLLREKLGLTGLKISCGEGACGACTVIMDGRAILSCMLLAVEAHGHEVLTIEGLPKDDPVITAFAQQCEPGHGTALQCGYCTPGFVMTARALLDENPAPGLAEVKQALGGNICRCGCYQGIAQAVFHAAEKISNRAEQEVRP